MSETIFTDNHLWSTETVRKLVTIPLPHCGEKFDRWYAHEINKAYQRGHDSYKEFFESTDPYERYRYLTTPPATEVLPEVVDQDNLELFYSPGAREYIWQDRDGDYWYWSESNHSWEWTTSITHAREGFDYRWQKVRDRPGEAAAPLTRVERVS